MLFSYMHFWNKIRLLADYVSLTGIDSLDLIIFDHFYRFSILLRDKYHKSKKTRNRASGYQVMSFPDNKSRGIHVRYSL